MAGDQLSNQDLEYLLQTANHLGDDPRAAKIRKFIAAQGHAKLAAEQATPPAESGLSRFINTAVQMSGLSPVAHTPEEKMALQGAGYPGLLGARAAESAIELPHNISEAAKYWGQRIPGIGNIPLKQTGEELSTIKPELAATAAVGALGEIGARRIPERIGPTPEELVSKGTGDIEAAARPRIGKAGQVAEKFNEDLQTAAPHLSQIAKEAPIDRSILQRITKHGDPEWFNQTASDIDAYKKNLWDTYHRKPLEEVGDTPLNTDKVVAQTRSEILPEDDAVQAEKANEWIDRELGKLHTLNSADTKIRLLNAELKKLPEEYGPVGVRVREAAVQSLRNTLDEQLAEHGYPGVTQANKEWGALRNIQRQLEGRYWQERGKAANSSIVPDWAHAYVFGHPGGVFLGAATNVSRMLKESPSYKLARGMGTLGRADLSVTLPKPAVQMQFQFPTGPLFGNK